MKTFRNLQVWQKAMDVSVRVYECQTQLEISYRVGFIQESGFKEMDKQYETIAKMLSSFIRKLSESENKC